MQPGPSKDQNQRTQQMKINAAEIDAYPRGATETVRLGGIRVKGRENQIQPHSDSARTPTTVSKRRGMPELVDEACDDDDSENGEKRARRVQDVRDAVADPVNHIHPPVRRTARDEQDDEQRNGKQPLQNSGERADESLRKHQHAQVDRDHRSRRSSRVR